MKRILFDAHAVLVWTQKEPGYERIKSLLVACRGDSITGYMSYINLGEVYYKTIRAVGLSQAKTFLENFLRLPVTLVLPDRDIVWKASEIKAEFAISYADCFSAATNIKYDAAILTGDPEFKKLKKLVSVEWIG